MKLPGKQFSTNFVHVFKIKCIFRSDICKVKGFGDGKGDSIDYIYCLRYLDIDSVKNNSTALGVTTDTTTVECNLSQRQRCSQQILDLADYLQMHSSSYVLRKYDSMNSFSSDTPLWIELSDPKAFFLYFKDFDSENVMLFWDILKKPFNFKDIEDFCHEKEWRCSADENVKGSEASVTILYDLDVFAYEQMTRAKTCLIIVTICGKYRYVFFQSLFTSSD